MQTLAQPRALAAQRRLGIATCAARRSRRRHTHTAVAASSPGGAGALVSERVATALRGTVVFVVGDNAAANAKLCDALAKSLGYAPLHTAQLLLQLTGQTLSQIEVSDGAAGVALAEAMVLEEVSAMARCCVATIGGGKGAAARGDCWRHLFGGVTVWLDERTAGDAPQREAYALAEVTLDASALNALSGADLAERALPALDTLLASDAKLVGKKSLYVRLGARGDWPDLQAPGASMPPLHGTV